MADGEDEEGGKEVEMKMIRVDSEERKQ